MLFESKYDESYPAKLIELSKKGASIAIICAEFDICEKTFYNWLEAHPEFAEAHDRGTILSEAWHEKRLLDTDLDTTSDARRIFYMKNRFRAKYGEQQEKQASQTVIETLLGLLSDKDK